MLQFSVMSSMCHFADVCPADVKVFSRDVNVDAKDQAVLSCNSASSESSSTQGPITPNKTKLTADQLLEQQLLKAARRRKAARRCHPGSFLHSPKPCQSVQAINRDGQCRDARAELLGGGGKSPGHRGR